MPLRVYLEGDKARAAAFLKWAKSKLFMLKANMKSFSQKQGSKFYTLNGVDVFISSLYDQDKIRIVVGGGVYVFVADTLNHRIQVFDINGNFKFTFGCYGEKDGQFLSLFDLDYYSNKLYITDTLQSKIHRFVPNGQYIDNKYEDERWVFSPIFNLKGLLTVGEATGDIFTYFYDKDFTILHKINWKSVDNIPQPADPRGGYDASGNTYPSSGGSGESGAILKGDFWIISVEGILGGGAVHVGDKIRAIVNAPGQTSTNWSVSIIEDYIQAVFVQDEEKFFIEGFFIYYNTEKKIYEYKSDGLWAYRLRENDANDYKSDGLWAYKIQEVIKGHPDGKSGSLNYFQGKYYSIVRPQECPDPPFETCIDVYDMKTLKFEKTIIPKDKDGNAVFRSVCDFYFIRAVDVHSSGFWITENYLGAGVSPFEDSERVIHLDFEGNLIKTFGTRGIKNGQFKNPIGIKVVELNNLSGFVNDVCKKDTGAAGGTGGGTGGDGFYDDTETGEDAYTKMDNDEAYPVISTNDPNTTIDKVVYDDGGNVTVFGSNQGDCTNDCITVKTCGMTKPITWTTKSSGFSIGGVTEPNTDSPWITIGVPSSGGDSCESVEICGLCTGNLTREVTITATSTSGQTATFVFTYGKTGKIGWNAGGSEEGGWDGYYNGSDCWSEIPQGENSIVPGVDEPFTADCLGGTPVWSLAEEVEGVSISEEGLLSADPDLTPCEGTIEVNFDCCGSETMIKEVEIFNPCSALTIVDEDGTPATDTTLRNGSNNYKYIGCCSGGVVWSVSVDSGSTLGGSTITQAGVLTAGATSCGSLKVTATCENCSTSATQYVRVTDNGRWVGVSFAYACDQYLHEVAQEWNQYLCSSYNYYRCTLITANQKTEYSYFKCPRLPCKTFFDSCSSTVPLCDPSDGGYPYDPSWCYYLNYTTTYEWRCS